MSDWIDISRSLHAGTPPWPGDTAFSFRLTWRMAEGANVNVGALAMGTHNGTHADAPFHYLPAGAGIDAVDLSVFVGPATVVEVSGISRADLEPAEAAIRTCGRVLLKTGAWRDPGVFPERYPVLENGVAAWLGGLGVRLVGVDVPSVDPVDSAELPNHHALAAAGIYMIESLDFTAVDPGEYELIALPLKIAGGDASPVRAVLRRLYGPAARNMSARGQPPAKPEPRSGDVNEPLPS